MLEALGLTIAGRLNGVTAQLRPGRVTAICGPNGAGKSTLLSALAGLLVPDSGTVTLLSKPLDQIARKNAPAGSAICRNRRKWRGTSRSAHWPGLGACPIAPVLR